MSYDSGWKALRYPNTPCDAPTCGHPWEIHLSDSCFQGWAKRDGEWLAGPDACDCANYLVPGIKA